MPNGRVLRSVQLGARVGALCCAAFSSPLVAGRALDEPPGLKKVARAVPRAVADGALGPVAERCRDQQGAAGLVGLECRARVAVAGAKQAPPQKPADLEARLSLIADLERAAHSVRNFEPLAPEPGFSRQRFDTHATLSRGMLELVDELGRLPAQHPAAARATELLKGPPRRIDAACSAVKESVDLATGADASVAERGALQALLTSHRCFLDDSRLVAERKPGEVLAGNKDAASIKSAVGHVGIMRQYAESRAIDFERCTGKFLDASGRPTDVPKLEACACGAVKRWTFPPRDSETSVVLPLGAHRLDLAVVAAPGGAVTGCGPLTVRAP